MFGIFRMLRKIKSLPLNQRIIIFFLIVAIWSFLEDKGFFAFFETPDPPVGIPATVTWKTGTEPTEKVFGEIVAKVAPNCTLDGRNEPDTCGWKVYRVNDMLQLNNDNGLFRIVVKTTNAPKKGTANMNVYCQYVGSLEFPHLNDGQCRKRVASDIKKKLEESGFRAN